MLNKDINYIVSGLERSGTSLMMQVINKGGLPIASDNSRPADEHNPKGYFELAGGKIINRLMEGTFDAQSTRGQVVKITAYGLKFLPDGNYKIIYMMRNMDEILKSMEKMGAAIDWEKDRTLFDKLNKFSFDLMQRRTDMEYITVNYADVLSQPRSEIERVSEFLKAPLALEEAILAVDPKLHRNKSAG